jgi:hypothetical protein
MMPYAGMSNDQVVSAVSSGTRLHQPTTCPDAIFGILLRCWAFKPTNRPTFQQLSQQLATIIRRLRQGATDYDLMQTTKLRESIKLRQSSHAQGLISARPLHNNRDVFDPARKSKRPSRASNQYEVSPRNSVAASTSSMQSAVYLQPHALGSRSSASSLDDGVTSRPYDDHALSGAFVSFNNLTVDDGTIVLEPEGLTKNESLRLAMDDSILPEYLEVGSRRAVGGPRGISLIDSEDDEDDYVTIVDSETAPKISSQRQSRLSAIFSSKRATKSRDTPNRPSPVFQGGAI